MSPKSVLSAKINMYIAVACVAAFGLFVTSYLLKLADLEDPVTGTVSAAIAATMAAQDER